MDKQCAFQNRLTKFSCGIFLFDSAFVLMQEYSGFLLAVLNRIKFFLDVKNQIGPVRIPKEKKKIDEVFCI